MRHILEPARHIEFIYETDVLVVGCGPGGLSNALVAARTVISVTSVERWGFFGSYFYRRRRGGVRFVLPRRYHKSRRQ